MSALATLDELKDRLDWELDADEERIGESALEDASEEARFYGSALWESTVCPPYVKTLVLRACKRYMDNPAGYTQSRAGDETLTWSDNDSGLGTVHFTEAEQAQLARLAGRSTGGIISTEISAWGTVIRPGREGRVPTGYGKTFPLFSNDEDNW